MAKLYSAYISNRKNRYIESKKDSIFIQLEYYTVKGSRIYVPLLKKAL